MGGRGGDREIQVHEREENDQTEGGMQRSQAEGKEGWAGKVGKECVRGEEG